MVSVNIGLVDQMKALRVMGVTKEIRIKKHKIEARLRLQPTPLSDTYLLGLSYNIRTGPRVWIISPDLVLPPRCRLPHVYDRNRLCLYYPKDKEWTPQMLIADTIVPWASEWLLHYEFWSVNKIWSGGGVKHRS